MAHRLIRPLRRTLLSPLSSYSKTLIPHQQPTLSLQTRTYITEMRKSAFEGNILRLLRNEIQYELDRSPPSQPVPEFNSFTVDERPGEQWIILNRKFGENEEIKVEVTMFDGSVPVQKTNNITAGEDVKLHITLIVDIFKGDGSDVLEFVCSAWPDSVEIQKVFTRGRDQMAGLPYMGPGYKELDDVLQDSLYEYLEARGNLLIKSCLLGHVLQKQNVLSPSYKTTKDPFPTPELSLIGALQIRRASVAGYIRLIWESFS